MRQAAEQTHQNVTRVSLVLIAAFAAVYIFWGSTYLAIKYAIETLPTFLLAGSRFFIAGSILYAWARLSPDYQRPTLKQWRTSFIVGTLLLLGGNGGVVLAEHYISSSLAALLIATEPFWIVLLGWLWLKGERPSWKVALGLLIGFLGVYLLISGQKVSDNAQAETSNQLFGTLLVIAAALSWAIGSIYGLRATTPKSSLLTSGMQMLAGGTVLLLVSFATGEMSRFHLTDVSVNSWLGFAYLMVFGSIVSFTAYSWLLKNAPPAMVATYAYVNPVIAVLLGWLIAGESFTTPILIGAAVIVGSVMLITSTNKHTEDSVIENDFDNSEKAVTECRAFSTSS